MSTADTLELGASVAMHFGKDIEPVQRQLSRPSPHSSSSQPNICISESLSSLSSWKSDRAKVLASQIVVKSYFAGEAAGLRLASSNGKLLQFPILWECVP